MYTCNNNLNNCKFLSQYIPHSLELTVGAVRWTSVELPDSSFQPPIVFPTTPCFGHGNLFFRVFFPPKDLNIKSVTYTKVRMHQTIHERAFDNFHQLPFFLQKTERTFSFWTHDHSCFLEIYVMGHMFI